MIAEIFLPRKHEMHRKHGRMRAGCTMLSRPSREVRLLTGAAARSALADFVPVQPPGPAQHPLWIASWMHNADVETILAMLFENDQPVFGLPLEIIGWKGLRIARYMSGSHANGNQPMTGAGLVADRSVAATLLVEALKACSPRLDLLWLQRQRPMPCGLPLPGFRADESPDPALAVSLVGGFDAVLSRHSGKRKRKKHRSQLRKFDAAGGWRMHRADIPGEISRFLDGFAQMKALQLARRGSADPFADDAVRTFFQQLFTEALNDPQRPFRLYGLEVGGRLRAVSGFSITDTSWICEFTAFADDELAVASPGEFLFFETIRIACEEGMEIFDFSVGDLAYKRLWCDLTERQVDQIIALSPAGCLALPFVRVRTALVRKVKRQPFLHKAALALRRLLRPVAR